MLTRIISILILTLCATAQSDDSDKIHKVGDGGITAPVPKFTPQPQYPTPAGKASLCGRVGLNIVIENDGKIQDVKLAHSLDPRLDEAAVNAVKQWQFTPCKKDGRPVSCALYVEVDFHLYGESDDPDRVYKIDDPCIVKAVAKSTPDPEYTNEAREKKIQGRVGLDVVIEKNGRVKTIKMVHSLDPSLDASAVKTVKSWRFKPCQKDGEPVRCSTYVEVTYHM